MKDEMDSVIIKGNGRQNTDNSKFNFFHFTL